MSGAVVKLNVYDMNWVNDFASTIGVGVYHSGIEVYGIEYAFGGHPFPFSGIFENTPGDAKELGDHFMFRESVLLGTTDFTYSDIRKMIKEMGDEYRGDRYHLITKNCNHFTAILAKTLTGQEIPAYINRLASISNSIPFLERWLPQEWLSPIIVEQTIENKIIPQRNGSINPQVINYPVERGVEASEDSYGTHKRNSLIVGSNGRIEPTDTYSSSSIPTSSTINSTASSWTPRWFTTRRNSNTDPINSAPATSRPTNGNSIGSSCNPSPTLTRLWNSIKAIGNDESATSGGLSNARKSPNDELMDRLSPRD